MRNGKYDLVVAPHNYPGRLYRGKYCYLHYLIFWHNYGKLPSENEIIHHMDGNTRNNDISNLMLMDRVEHVVYHNSLRDGPSQVLFKCPVCEKIFVRDKRQTHLIKHGIATYCSRKCAYKANSLRAHNDKTFEKNISQNVICQITKQTNGGSLPPQSA